MENFQNFYLLTAAAIAGLMIWGRLEWYAAIILGFIAPFVGMIMVLPLNVFFAWILPKSLAESELLPGIVAYGLTVVGAFFLAKTLRKTKGKGT